MREAHPGDGEQVARRRRLGKLFFLKKKRIILNLLEGGLGGSPGGLGRSGKPVGLEKLVGSRTMGVFPLRPESTSDLFVPGSIFECPRKPKEFQENPNNF